MCIRDSPKRPQDLILLSDAKQEFQYAVVREAGVRGFGLDTEELAKTAKVDFEDHSETIQTGHVAIAAITSCTNTSNPYVLMDISTANVSLFLPYHFSFFTNVLTEAIKVLFTGREAVSYTHLLAVIQGGIATLGYYLFDVPSALLFGFLTCFATVIPIVGTALV